MAALRKVTCSDIDCKDGGPFGKKIPEIPRFSSITLKVEARKKEQTSSWSWSPSASVCHIAIPAITISLLGVFLSPSFESSGDSGGGVKSHDRY